MLLLYIEIIKYARDTQRGQYKNKQRVVLSVQGNVFRIIIAICLLKSDSFDNGQNNADEEDNRINQLAHDKNVYDYFGLLLFNKNSYMF